MPNPPVIVASIKAELARRGKTQRDVAGKLGISEAAVSERFNGKTRITVDELYAIAELLDMPAAALMAAS